VDDPGTGVIIAVPGAGASVVVVVRSVVCVVGPEPQADSSAVAPSMDAASSQRRLSCADVMVCLLP
jgi:hypothetical protein